jgi:hypothetical protein
MFPLRAGQPRPPTSQLSLKQRREVDALEIFRVGDQVVLGACCPDIGSRESSPAVSS